MRWWKLIGVLGLVLIGACDPGAFDRLMRGATQRDGGMDAGALDASTLDSGVLDASVRDAAVVDGGMDMDAGELDAGTHDAGMDAGARDAGDDGGDGCVGLTCGGECEPGTRSCIDNAPNECSNSGTWQAEAACSAGSPVCVGAGECRCFPGSLRCGGDGTQPQLCNATNQWVNVGASCANCDDGTCPTEGCSAARASECGTVACHCANNDCSGGFCALGDGCTAERRSACQGHGCGCVDGACSGGACAGTGCTARAITDCSAQECGCAMQSCTGACGTD